MKIPRPEDFSDIDPSAAPILAADFLVSRARELGHHVEDMADFDRLMRLEFPSYAIYAALADRTYSVSATQINTSRTIHLVDYLPTPDLVGSGEVGMTIAGNSSHSHSYLHDGPLVLNTESLVRRKGYGRNRYLAMNAASLLIFGQPLHSRDSGPHRTVLAERRWEAFVREGLAEEFEDKFLGEPVQRYRFKPRTARPKQP